MAKGLRGSRGQGPIGAKVQSEVDVAGIAGALTYKLFHHRKADLHVASPGRDLIAFDESDADGGLNRITNFKPAQGDSLDLSELLDGATMETLGDYIQVDFTRGGATLRIDVDGDGSGYTDLVIKLHGIKLRSIDDLMTWVEAGTLILPDEEPGGPSTATSWQPGDADNEFVGTDALGEVFTISEIPSGVNLSVVPTDDGKVQISLSTGEVLFIDGFEELTIDGAETVDISGDFSGTDIAPSTFNYLGTQGPDVFTADVTSFHSVLALGSGGNDVLTGGRAGDRIFGGNGDDTLVGNDGRDFLFGGADNDDLDGGNGADELSGGSGDDVLRGGPGDDALVGGDGVDTVVVNASFDEVTITGTTDFAKLISPTDGTDRLEGVEAIRFDYGPVEIYYLDAPNQAPVVVPDTGETDARTSVLIDVSLNDYDPDPDDDESTLTYTLLTQPEFGSVDNNNDGTFTFDPGGDFYLLAEGETQTVSFGYNATDSHGAVSIGRAVTIVVTGLNDVPISLDDGVRTNADTAVLFDVSTNDLDDDMPSVTYNVVDAPTGGALTNHGDGTFTFDPGNDFTGLHTNQVWDVSFTYQIVDPHGLAGNIATATIFLVGVPYIGTEGDDTWIAEPTSTMSTTADGLGGDDHLTGGMGRDALRGGDGNDTLIGLNSNDLLFGGADNDTLDGGGGVDELSGGPGDDVLRGGPGDDTLRGGSGFDTVLVNGSFADVTITGDNTLAFLTSPLDGFDRLENIEAIRFDQGPIEIFYLGDANNPPQIVSDFASTTEDDPVLIDVSANDYDPDPDDDETTLTYEPTSEPSGGTVLNNNDGTFTFDPGTDFDGLAVGEEGETFFFYQATDSHGALSVSRTVTVTVTGVNDAPDLADDTGGTLADASTNIDVSANDDDVDSDDTEASLAFALVTGPLKGSVTNNDDGTFTFDPGTDFDHLVVGTSEDVSFTYKATDSHGLDGNATTVTVTVTGVATTVPNQVPVVEAAKIVALGSDAGTVGLDIAPPIDPDGDPMSVEITGLPTNGTVALADGTVLASGAISLADLAGLMFTPDAGATVSSALTYAVSDGQGGVTAGSIAINIAVTDPVVTDTFGSNPHDLVEFGGSVYFTADDGTGDQGWVYDGVTTAAVPDVLGNMDHAVMAIGNKLYYIGENAAGEESLWAYNSATDTTLMVMVATDFQQFTAFNGSLYFRAKTLTHGGELFFTDGTGTNDFGVFEGKAGTASGYPTIYGVEDGKLFFHIQTDFGVAFYATTGGSDFTGYVSSQLSVSQNNEGQLFHDVNGVLYYVNQQARDGNLLATWDGVNPGESVTDIQFARLTDLTVLDGALYFLADIIDGPVDEAGNPVTGKGLFRYDGTDLVLVDSNALTWQLFQPAKDMYAVGGKVYYLGSDNGVWSYDDANGTVRVTDLPPASSDIRVNFFEINGKLAIFMDQTILDQSSVGLHILEGNTFVHLIHTAYLADLQSLDTGDSFYFVTDEASPNDMSPGPDLGKELWVYDGTGDAQLVVDLNTQAKGVVVTGGLTLTGAEGNDILVSSVASDTMTGNGGADAFLFSVGDTGANVIKDFSISDGDQVDLTALFSPLGLGDESGLGLDGYMDFTFDGTNTRLEIDLDLDGVTDMSILFEGVDLVGTDDDATIIDSLLAGGGLDVL